MSWTAARWSPAARLAVLEPGSFSLTAQCIHKDPIAADALRSQSHFSYSLAGWSPRTCQIRSPQCISACAGPWKEDLSWAVMCRPGWMWRVSNCEDRQCERSSCVQGQSCEDKSQHVGVLNSSSRIYSLWWLITGVQRTDVVQAFQCSLPRFPALLCAMCLACYTKSVSQSRPICTGACFCVSLFLEEKRTHQDPLVFTVTGQPSTERLSLAELSHCLRQWSGIFTNRLRHCAICAGHLPLALLLIYVLLSRLKSKASHPRPHTVSYVPPQVNKWAD